MLLEEQAACGHTQSKRIMMCFMGKSQEELAARSILRQMIQESARMPDIYQPSNFWRRLSAINIAQLEQHGLENFKRTLNQNYYNWVPTSLEDNQIRRLLAFWAGHPSTDPLKVIIEDQSILYDWPHGTEKPLEDAESRTIYRFFVGLQWWYAQNNDPFRFLKDLSEPVIGNPIRTTLNGRLISQDIANSVRELTTLCEVMPLHDLTPTILELGAGYGRLCYVAKSVLRCRYIVVDIPPALYVAQWYLQRVFPDRPIFTFRPFSTFANVEREFNAADVCFISPNQLQALPDLYADVAISISSLHEMHPRQIAHYKSLLANKTRSIVYFKQWIRTLLDGTLLTRGHYSLDHPWNCVVDRTDPIQDLFFETVYLRSPAQ